MTANELQDVGILRAAYSKDDLWPHCQAFYAPVDGPPLHLVGREFHGGVMIVAQPTYGRFLFRTHDILVQDCTFYSS